MAELEPSRSQSSKGAAHVPVCHRGPRAAIDAASAVGVLSRRELARANTCPTFKTFATGRSSVTKHQQQSCSSVRPLIAGLSRSLSYTS